MHYLSWKDSARFT